MFPPSVLTRDMKKSAIVYLYTICYKKNVFASDVPFHILFLKTSHLSFFIHNNIVSLYTCIQSAMQIVPLGSSCSLCLYYIMVLKKMQSFLQIFFTIFDIIVHNVHNLPVDLGQPPQVSVGFSMFCVIFSFFAHLLLFTKACQP